MLVTLCSAVDATVGYYKTYLQPVSAFPGASVYGIGDRSFELDRRSTKVKTTYRIRTHFTGLTNFHHSILSVEYERSAAIRSSRCTLFQVPEFAPSPVAASTTQVHDITRISLAVRLGRVVTICQSLLLCAYNPYLTLHSIGQYQLW